jgi:hypothetical protein
MKILKTASQLVLVALALVLSSGAGKAQALYKGTFTLPVEVRWGAATLPPGNYTLQLDSVSAPRFIRVDGEGKSALILTGSHDPFEISNHSQLVLAETAQGYAVRSFEVGEYGVSIDFAVSKHNITQYASNGKPSGKMEVPVRGGH